MTLAAERLEGDAVPPLLSLRDVRRTYGAGAALVRALDGVDLDVRRGEFVAITGPSGSGKSSVLSILGLLDVPTSGEYRIEGVPVQSLRPDVLAALRNSRFGFVFQSFNLLPRTTARANVELPLVYGGLAASEQHRRAREALARVGLAGRETARPSELSGGEQQRVAIARAIVNEPEVLFADEPTGNLDTRTGREILELLEALNRERALTVLMVTHDPSMAARAGRQLEFRDGRLVRDGGPGRRS